MTRKWTIKYGLAAVLTATLIISVALFANPSILPQKVSAQASLAVMLTDPPTVPAGTTVLNLTYSDISLHVDYGNGTAEWLSVGSSGTVNSFSLINMSQTIASTTLPTNSSVDKIQLTIAYVAAVINGTTYNVTTLSDTLVLQVRNSQINQTLSGVLIDFNPTLVQIQSVDANGNPVDYYVLVPSATAAIVNSLDRAQVKVGTIVRLGDNDRHGITNVVQDFSQNIAITSASLSVSGNTTSLSVTLQNNGDLTFRIFGVMLQGQFNPSRNDTDRFPMPDRDFSQDTIPFQINDTSLIPMIGPGMMSGQAGSQMPPMMGNSTAPLNEGARGSFFGNGTGNAGFGMQFGEQGPPFMNQHGSAFNMTPWQGKGMQSMNPPMQSHDDRTGNAAFSYLALQPGETVTLTFNGVIAPLNGLQAKTPIAGNTYTIQLTGEGFQTYTVTAQA